MIMCSTLSKMKNKILPTYLQGNYRDSLGEFSSISYDIFGAEIIKRNPICCHGNMSKTPVYNL